MLKMATLKIARIETTGGGFHIRFFYLLRLLFHSIMETFFFKAMTERAVLCIPEKEGEGSILRQGILDVPSPVVNSGNFEGCHFQHGGARERES